MDRILKEHNFTQIYLVTKILKNDENEMYREVLIYPEMDTRLENYLMSDHQLKFTKVIDCQVTENVTHLTYDNMKLTRKYILPVIAKYY